MVRAIVMGANIEMTLLCFALAGEAARNIALKTLKWPSRTAEQLHRSLEVFVELTFSVLGHEWKKFEKGSRLAFYVRSKAA